MTQFGARIIQNEFGILVISAIIKTFRDYRIMSKELKSQPKEALNGQKWDDLNKNKTKNCNGWKCINHV